MLKGTQINNNPTKIILIPKIFLIFYSSSTPKHEHLQPSAVISRI